MKRGPVTGLSKRQIAYQKAMVGEDGKEKAKEEISKAVGTLMNMQMEIEEKKSTGNDPAEKKDDKPNSAPVNNEQKLNKILSDFGVKQRALDLAKVRYRRCSILLHSCALYFRISACFVYFRERIVCRKVASLRLSVAPRVALSASFVCSPELLGYKRIRRKRHANICAFWVLKYPSLGTKKSNAANNTPGGAGRYRALRANLHSTYADVC